MGSLRDAIADLIQSRRELAKWSMETGIARHGDLTQMDRRIAELAEAEREQQGRERERERTR